MKQILLVILFCFSLLSDKPMATPLSAVTADDHLETEAVSESDRQVFLDILDVEMLNAAQQQNTIVCFAISSDGAYALGFENFRSKTVYVFDHTGAFRHGYQFEVDGSFGIFFSGENLSIYYSRSRYVVTWDSVGQCIDLRIATMSEYNNAIINELLYGTEQESTHGIYSLERDLGLTERSYSRLVVCNTDGSYKILYDISKAHAGRIIASSIFFVGFTVMLCIIIRFWTKNHIATNA